MFERIDHVVRPDMRDYTATDELLQEARSDFDQHYRRAVALEDGNDLSECADARCINRRHVAHVQNQCSRGPLDVREHVVELPGCAQEKWVIDTVNHHAAGAVTSEKTTSTRAQGCPDLESTLQDRGISRAGPAH